jgi:hypothetical protein
MLEVLGYTEAVFKEKHGVCDLSWSLLYCNSLTAISTHKGKGSGSGEDLSYWLSIFVQYLSLNFQNCFLCKHKYREGGGKG